MGYTTIFNLSWEPPQPTRTEVARVITMLTVVEQVEAGETRAFTEAFGIQKDYWPEEVSAWERILDGRQDSFWYEHQIIMARASRFWPEVTFTLEAEGEGEDDHWREYFRNGKVQAVVGRMDFPPHDPAIISESLVPVDAAP